MLAPAADNLDKRTSLFEVMPGREAIWRNARADYVNSVVEAEEAGKLGEARVRAGNALQFLPANDRRVPAMRATMERLMAAASFPVNPRPAFEVCLYVSVHHEVHIGHLVRVRYAADLKTSLGGVPCDA